MFRRITCLVLLSLLVGMLLCGPALAAEHSLVPRPDGFYQEGGGGVGGSMGYLSVALIGLIIVMGFVNSSKRLMKNVKPKGRIWLTRVHGFLGVAALVTIIIHIMTVGH